MLARYPYALQGCLAHKKPMPRWHHRRVLGIGLLRGSGGLEEVGV